MTSVQGIGIGRSVLIVEDDKAMSVALCDGLASEGFKVVCAANGEDGFSLATGRTPDVVILDVMLPRLNGLDVCRKLRADGNDVPIIMLTARGQEADRVLGLKPSNCSTPSGAMTTCRSRAPWTPTSPSSERKSRTIPPTRAT